MSRFMGRVNGQIKREISIIIGREVDNPAIEFISITRVDTSKDLRQAKVYFSVYPQEKREIASDALAKMKDFIRTKLGRRLRLKFLPEITFILDTNIEYSVDIYAKMEEIKHELEENQESDY